MLYSLTVPSLLHFDVDFTSIESIDPTTTTRHYPGYTIVGGFWRSKSFKGPIFMVTPGKPRSFARKGWVGTAGYMVNSLVYRISETKSFLEN